MKRLSPMQRGYMMGLRRARAQAQRELNDQADRFENVIAEIHAEMRGVRDELARLRMLDDAILAERGVPMKAQMSAFREWPSSDAYFAAIATQLQKRAQR